MPKFKYGVWYPIKDYYENINDLDWAIVQFKETKTGFLPLPYRAEYHQRDKIWFTDTDADRYLCELCEPIAFMLWQPIEEIFKKDGGRMTGQEYIQRQINLVKQQIKGSRVKFTITDAVTKFQYDFYENELQALESIEKEHNALEIIKKKTVDIWLIQNKKTLKQYNLLVDESRQLTKEEFSLLKEILE